MTDHARTTDTPGGPELRPGWEKRVETLIGSVRGAYERLDEMGLEQADLISREKVDELLTVLGRRQRVVDDITELAAELGPFVGDWDALSARLPEDMRVRLREELDAIEVLRNRIAQRDAAHEKALVGERNAVADRIASVGRSQVAMSAYGGGPKRSAPRYQDREG